MKKFLSLVLALVMTMSLVTVSAGAKDFDDNDKINYDEAVAVMSAVKVIDGYTDGSFKPQGSLTRGAAAKIICNLILGPTTAAELSADTAPYKDVPVDHTFAGYIAYCAKEGIISGYADGAFRPAAPLTGYAFMKMLLGALGYDSDVEGFTGANWSINVAKRALGIGLNAGLMDTFNGVKNVNREEACLYALNTLKATMVEYDSKFTANVGGASIVVGNSVANDVEWNIASKTDGNIKDDDYVQFAEKYFTKLELEVGNGIYGRPANTWKTNKKEIGTFTSIAPTYVYTENTAEEDVYKDLGKDVCDEDEYTWTAFVNGEEVDDVKVPEKKNDEKYVYTDKGSVTEIYVNDDNEDDKTVTVVEINYYLGQVSSVKEKNDETTISVRALSKEAKLDDRSFVTNEFEKDEYVVFTVTMNDDDEFVIAEVMAPETVTGEVTRVQKDDVSKDTYLRLNGETTKYFYTALKTHMVYDVADTTKNEHPELNEEYVLYMTPAGYVLGFEPATETVDQYLWVVDSDEELRDWVARIVLTDGTDSKVEVDKDLNKTPDDFDGGEDINWIESKYDGDDEDKSNIDDRIWKYSVNDKDVYSLTYVDFGRMTADINNGKSYVEDLESETDFIVDKQTIFVDVEGETSYVGYKEVPNIEEADIAYVLNDQKVAEVVFIFDGEIYDADSTYFMLTSTDRDSMKHSGDKYWEYFDAYVNGDKQTVTVAYDAVEDLLDNANARLSTGVLYKAVKTIDEQYIVELEIAAELDEDFSDVVSVGDEAFRIMSTTTENVEKFNSDEETVFVVVEEIYNKDGSFDKYSIYEGDINDMFVGTDSDGYKTTVCVVEDDKTDAELVYIHMFTVSDEYFEMQDFGPWTDAEHEGWWNVGWKYAADFYQEDVIELEVGLLDADGKKIVTYTADEEQVENQRDGEYGLYTSASFRQAKAEGDYDDWSVEHGSAFAAWEPASCYVTVTTEYGSQTLYND